MKTEDLIVRLAADAVPVRRLPGIPASLARWIAVVVPVLVAGVAAFGPRTDLATRAGAPAFLFSIFAVMALAVTSAMAAMMTSVPGDERASLVRVLPAAMMLAWASALVVRLGSARPVGSLVDEPIHLACAAQIALMAALPAVILARRVKAGASVTPQWSGVLTLAASLAAGAAGSALICPIDRAAHETLWHLLPVLAFSALGALAGQVVFSRLAR